MTPDIDFGNAALTSPITVDLSSMCNSTRTFKLSIMTFTQLLAYICSKLWLGVLHLVCIAIHLT